MISINNQLKELYDSQWDNLYAKLACIIKKEDDKDKSSKKKKPSNPLLLQMDEKAYNEADIILMFYGQESNGWKNELKTNTKEIIKNYKDFFISGKAFERKKGWYWRTIQMLINKVEEKYPNKKVYPIWNNVLKIGKEDGRGKPIKSIRITERDNFKVSQKELEIIKPDIVVFFSGPNYDHFIRNKFTNASMVKMPSIEKKQLCKVKLSECNNVFRTYHPTYLNRLGAETRENYLNTIVNHIAL